MNSPPVPPPTPPPPPLPPSGGVINLDKPAGISSAWAVDQVKRLLPRKTKIGHAGTLDPFATGVLLLLVGKATRQCERLMDQPKQYEATVRFGATTATDDPESPPTPWPRPIVGPGPTLDQVRSVLANFVGSIQQRPPAFSALKVAGQRAYDLARGGQEVKLEPRTVRVYGIELLDYAWPLLRLRIDCGRGTYIRAIARKRGGGGHPRAAGFSTDLSYTELVEFLCTEVKAQL